MARDSSIRSKTAVPADFSDPDWPGRSAFYNDTAGDVFHTYSTYTRALEEPVGTLMLLHRASRGHEPCEAPRPGALYTQGK